MSKSKHFKRKYTAEFKADVLRQISEGETKASIARRLGINERQIYLWQEVYLGIKEGIQDTLQDFEKLRQHSVTREQKLQAIQQEYDALVKVVSILSRQIG